MSMPIAQIKLRYESSDAVETRYVFVLGEDIKVMRVYVDNATCSVSISRADVHLPTHIVPVEALMTEEPDSSERGDRRGMRVKGSHLASQLVYAFQLMLVALSANCTVGQVIALNDLPLVTDADLENFLKE